MELEQQFAYLRRKHTSELGFTFALAHFLMFPSSAGEPVADLERNPGPDEVVVEHGDNGLALAGRLLKMLSSD